MANRLNAFVPAAGIGERLWPITAHMPKPLVPILGKPLLERAIERVCALPVNRIGVNLHYRPEAFASWLDRVPWRQRITTFSETVLLGTGGALKNAESLLAGSTFIVHNADVLTDIDLAALTAAHEASGNIGTLALHNCPAHNKVAISEQGAVLGVRGYGDVPPAARTLAYTGLAVYDPAIFDFIPPGVSNVVHAWLASMAAGWCVGGVDVSGDVWHDAGTPASLAAAVVDTLRRDGEWVYAADSIDGIGVEVDGYVVLEAGCHVEPGAVLRNAILLPDGRAARGECFQNCIVGPGFHLRLTEREFLGTPSCEHGEPIGVGGSGRRYYRFRNGEKTAVRMICPPDEADYDRHIAYSDFFSRNGVAIPKLLCSDPVAKRAEFEDLGDCSLYNYLRVNRSASEIEAVYRRVLRALIPLHVDAARNVHECALLADRIFDYGYFRWESAYFMERFVKGLRGIRPYAGDAVDEDLDALARRADALPKAVIHRDLQSQNIMITRSEPHFIDYQGARLAPPAYDIASVLWDPYFRIEDAIRDRLLAHYIELLEDRMNGEFDESAFREALNICRLQRHMQALGAYGFLSVVRGKCYFRKHIPEGLRLLKSDIAETGEAYPALAELVWSL